MEEKREQMLQIFYESQDFFLVNSSVTICYVHFSASILTVSKELMISVPNVKMCLFVTVSVHAFLLFFCLFVVLKFWWIEIKIPAGLPCINQITAVY